MSERPARAQSQRLEQISQQLWDPAPCMQCSSSSVVAFTPPVHVQVGQRVQEKASVSEPPAQLPSAWPEQVSHKQWDTAPVPRQAPAPLEVIFLLSQLFLVLYLAPTENTQLASTNIEARATSHAAFPSPADSMLRVCTGIFMLLL